MKLMGYSANRQRYLSIFVDYSYIRMVGFVCFLLAAHNP